MKYLQSAKIAAKIGASCESKEYSAEVVAKFNEICVSELITKSKFSSAVAVLKEVLQIVQDQLLKEGEEETLPEDHAEYQNLQRLTLNNLGCALKKSGNIDEAQFYFEQITSQDPLYELNLCAVQSQKGNHRQALHHAQQAATILEAEVKELRAQIENGDLDNSSDKDYFLERTSLLAIAFYNQGCELEHLENLLRATQAFSRAVSLQSSKNANQQLLTQFKLSLKQARFKLKQQLVPDNLLSQSKVMGLTTMSVPTQKYQTKSVSIDRRPYSAINNQPINPYKLYGTSSRRNFPKLQKVQLSRTYSTGNKEQQRVMMRQSVHSNMSQNSQQSQLSEQQQAIVDQMNKRPSQQDSRLSRGKKQANQSGSNHSSNRQKQILLRASDPDLNTGINLAQNRSTSASKPKGVANYNLYATSKPSTKQSSLPPVSQSKSVLLSNKPAALNSSPFKQSEKISIQAQKYSNPQNKIPPSQTNLYPNKQIDKTKALKALKDLGLAKGSQQQQNKALESILKIQRWIRLRLIRKKFVKAIRKDAQESQAKNAKFSTKYSKSVAQKKQKVLNLVESYDRFGSGPNAAKMQKCAKIIQSWFRRRKFRKLVHAMIIRRKVQQGKYSKKKLDEIGQKTLKQLEDLDNKLKHQKVAKRKEDLKRQKAVNLIQSLFRRRRVRNIVASIAKAARESAKNGQPASKVKANVREAFIKKILQKAKEIREAELRQNLVYRQNLSKTCIVLQRWIRRRRFRKAVYAMILFRKVSTGRLPISHLKKVDASTYNMVLNANKMRKLQDKHFKELQVKEKAVKLIQRMFRRRRFRSIVNIIIKIQKETRAKHKYNKYTSIQNQQNERKLTLQSAFEKHKQQVSANAAIYAKKKKAIRLIQSFVRRRKFRKLIEARILLHKFQQGRIKASALRKIDPKIKESILNADRRAAIQQKKEARGVRIIQRFIRIRRFRQLVFWMIQVRKLSNQNATTKNKKLTDLQISQLASKAKWIRKQSNIQMIKQRKRERVAKKVIGNFVRRWRFRRAVNALIAIKKIKKRNNKTLSTEQKIQLYLSERIHKERQQIAIDQRRREICVRMIQRFIRVRRFRKTVEAIVEINRRYRSGHIAREVLFKQKVWEAQALKRQWEYERIVRNRKERRALALIQSFIRRRKFRKVVEAVLLSIRIKNGKASPKEIKNAKFSPLVKKQLEEWNSVSKKADRQNKKTLKAVRMIQSWYRRRKFRKLVDAIVELRRGSKNKGKLAKVPINIDQANKVRKNLLKEEILKKQRYLKAIKLVQRWFRRRRFRQLVFAMVVKSQVQKRKLTGASLDKFSKQTLDRLNKADQFQKQIQQHNRKEQKAIQFVQRWYRMRRFRNAVLALKEAAKAVQSDWVTKRHYLSAKEKAIFDERIVMKANFIRKQKLNVEIEKKIKTRKAIKFLQSWWRRRKFRKAVTDVIARRRKIKQTPDKHKISSQSKSKIVDKPNIKEQTPVKNQKQAQSVSRNFVSPQKQRNLTETVPRKHSESTFEAQTPKFEAQNSQKIVIDYWQDGMQIEFQQAHTKKKPLVLVNLVINQQTVDRKVLQVDLYKCALDAGDFDLQHFCDQWLMPCLLIKEKNGKHSLQVLEELVSELFYPKEINVNELGNPKAASVSSLSRHSDLTEGTLKLLQKKLTGMIPLVKRNVHLDNRDFIVQAICDFDMQVIKLTAEREDAYLYLNVQLNSFASPISSDQLPKICAYATDLTHQLTIVRDELQLRKAQPFLHEEEVLIRTNATINDRFYLIGIGFKNGGLIIEALDKAREIRLHLKVDKYSANSQITQEIAQKLVARLDTKTTNAETVLVLK